MSIEISFGKFSVRFGKGVSRPEPASPAEGDAEPANPFMWKSAAESRAPLSPAQREREERKLHASNPPDRMASGLAVYDGGEPAPEKAPAARRSRWPMIRVK